MKRKRFFAGTLAVVLAFSLAVIGCETDPEDDGYMFKFKVDNNTSATITKVEFINGNTQNDKVVGSTLNITANNRSTEHSLSGFTVEAGSSRRYCGVKVTYSGGSTKFSYSSYGHQSKILVSVGDNSITFSEGNW
jgi:hypothetical protein